MPIKKMDKWLLLSTVILFAIGLVMIFSASNVAAFMRYSSSPFRFVIRQGVILLGSLIASMYIIRKSTKTYSVLSWIGIICILVLLTFVLIYGKTTNSATSWIAVVGSFRLQPSELLKVIMIIWMASFYEVQRKKLSSYGTSLFPLMICGIGMFLIILQPDWGTAIIYGAIVGFIFLISPVESNIKFKTICIAMGVGIIFAIVLLSGGSNLISERQTSRFNLTSPCSEEKFYTDGNQVCNAYIAVNNGGLFGKGLGNSTQKYLYLPEAHTDFIFAIVIEELGLVSGIAIILLYMFVLARIIIIGRRSNNNRSAIMCYGVAVYIFIHIFVNLFGIFGLIPMTGVPLPFMSYGGSFTLSLVMALTIVQRVHMETNTTKEI